MGGWHPDHTKAITWDAQTVNTVGVLDAHPVLGTVVELLEGLLDHPEYRVQNRVRPGRHGSRRGRLKLGARGFAMSGIIFGAGRNDLETRKAALQAILVPSDDAKVFGYEHPTQGLQQVTARIEQPLVWGDPFELGAVGPLIGCRWQVGFTAHDPRRYAQTLQSVQTTDIATGGGMSFPVAFPLSFGSGASGGSVTVPAGGNFERPATLRIYGPDTNPIVESLGLDDELSIVFDGLTVNEGDVLTIDIDEQTSTLAAATAADYPRLVKALDPRAYWQLGEDPGASTALDSAANQLGFGPYPGTYTNSPSVGEAGTLALDDNGATNFDGTNDYVTVPFAAGLNPASPWSIEAWVNPDTLAGTDTILDAITANLGFRLDLNAGVPRATVGTGAGTSSVSGAVAITTGVWHHIAATYDGTTLRLYVDGALVNSGAVTYSANTAGATTIGAVVGGGSNYFDGRLDEVAIYAVQLTAGQVQQHYLLASVATTSELNAYPYLDFDQTRFRNLPPEAVTLRLRGSTISDPAYMQVDVRNAYV